MGRQLKIWKIIVMMIVLLGVVLNVAWAGPEDEVKIGIRYDTTTASVVQMKMGNDIAVISILHESLMGADPKTGDRYLSLAERIDVSDDGMELKIVIKKGSLFHTGDPVTAHDVKFTYDQCVLPINNNILASSLDNIEAIRVVDDYTLIFKLWDPWAAWQEMLWVGICSKKYYEKVGPEIFHKKPVGSGPFEFVERRVGEHFIVKAANNHWAGKIDLGTLKFITVEDDMSRLAMLETGALDLVSEILPHQLRRLKRNKKIKIKTSSKVPSLFGISFQTKNFPLMKDRELKLAINHAINRQEIVDKIFLGKGYPLHMLASVAELGYDPSISFEFNPEKARDLLKKSAYKPGMALTLSYSNDIPNSTLVATVIQKYLKNIGIKIRLQKLEVGTKATYSKTQDKRMGEMGLYAWAGNRDPDLRMQLTFLSTGPYAAYIDRPNKKEYDALIIKQGREMNPEKRLAILSQIHELSMKDPGSATLFGLDMIYAMQDRIDYTWTPYESVIINTHEIKILK